MPRQRVWIEGHTFQGFGCSECDWVFKPSGALVGKDLEEMKGKYEAQYGKEGQPERVLQKVSQETLAEMIGTTRSRVNLFMNKFRKLGFIEYNGEIKINKSLLTVVLHE